MKRRILIIDNSPGVTGAFKSIWNYSRQLSSIYDFHFAIPRKSSIVEFLIENNVPFICIRFIEIRKKWSTLFYLPALVINATAVSRYCRNNSIVAIHVNDLYNLVGWMAAKFSEIGLVYHVRLLPQSYVRGLYGFWIRCIADRANRVITVSRTSERAIRHYTDRDIDIIHDALTPSMHQTFEQKDPDVITILYPANYTRGKGQDLAIKAIASAMDRLPRVQLKFVGDDFGLIKNIRYRNDLIKLVMQKGLSKVVSIEGPCDHIEALMHEVDIVLNFSTSESFSMVCLEALMYGTPVIATKSGGPEELIEPGVSGLLVEKGDLRQMEQAIIDLAIRPELRERFSKNGIERAKLFDLESGSKKLMALYDDIFNSVTA